MSTENTQLVLSTTQDGRTKDLRYRQRQFRALHEWMSRHPSEIQAALQKDDGLSELEAQFLFTLLSNKLREFYDSLDLKTELANEYSIKAGRDNAERMVSEDLTYVIPAKWALIFNVFSVLYACMAAGSCCVVEVREVTNGRKSGSSFYSFQKICGTAQVLCGVFSGRHWTKPPSSLSAADLLSIFSLAASLLIRPAVSQLLVCKD